MNATGPEDTLVGGFHGGPDRDAADDVAVDVLSEPPTTRDVTDELAAPPRRGLSRVTLALAAGVLVAGGFWAGVEVGEDGGSAAPGGAAAARAQGAGGQAAGAPGQATQGAQGAPGQVGQTGQQGGRQGSGSGATTGTVKVVDGSFIYLSDASGNIVKVRTTDTTTIQVQRPGLAADIRPGDTVVVRGTTGDDGTLSATTVTEGTQAAGPGAGGTTGTGTAAGSSGAAGGRG
jgi:hypothetical protein